MNNTSICYGANNYIDILYFLSHSVIHPHIDRLTFSCSSEIVNPEEISFSVLEDNSYISKSGSRIKGVAYKRIRI